MLLNISQGTKKPPQNKDLSELKVSSAEAENLNHNGNGPLELGQAVTLLQGALLCSWSFSQGPLLDSHSPSLLHLTLWIIEGFHILHLPFLLCPHSVLPPWNLFHLPTSVSTSLITALSSYLCLLWLTVARAKFITCLMSYKSANMVLFSCFVSSLVLSTRCPLLNTQITPKIQIKS